MNDFERDEKLKITMLKIFFFFFLNEKRPKKKILRQSCDISLNLCGLGIGLFYIFSSLYYRMSDLLLEIYNLI